MLNIKNALSAMKIVQFQGRLQSIALSVERLTLNPEVWGSVPVMAV